MSQKRCSRRDFIKRTGAAAGTLVLGEGLAGPLRAGHSSAERAEGVVATAGRSRGRGIPDHDRLEEILAEIVRDLDRRSLYASALFHESEGLSVSANRREKSVHPNPRTAGVVLQAYDGHHFHEASTDELHPDALDRLAKKLRKDLATPPRGVPRIDPGPALVARRKSPVEIDPTSLALSEWRSRAERLLEQTLALDPRIRSVHVGLNGSRSVSIFVNATRRLRQDLSTSGIGIFVFAADGGKTGTGGLRRRGLAGLEIAEVEQKDLEEVGTTIEETMGAERIPGGTYNVITAPGPSGLLVHESFGHGVEYDQFIKGRAKAAHYLGKRVASEGVNIWDDPSVPGANGSYYFDDEGWEASPTQIVKDGIFIHPITDLFSAHEGGIPRTANGRRQEVSHKAYARMSNTFFGRGTVPIPEMIASLDDGVLLHGFMSGMEDPHGWGIQLTCHRGYEIRNGKRTGRVFSPVGVTGYVPDILGSIHQIGDDFELVPGRCGKGHKEWVSVSSGGPHLAFRARLG